MTEATFEDSEVQAAAIDARSAGRRAMLAGSIVPTLMRLALPTITVLIAQTMVGIAETYYVGFLGTDALVGVSVVFPIWMPSGRPGPSRREPAPRPIERCRRGGTSWSTRLPGRATRL